MLKIKDCLFNKDEIKYIEPYENMNKQSGIYVKFKGGDYFVVYFNSQKKEITNLIGY